MNKTQTNTDLTDIVVWMRKTDAYDEPAKANALLTAGAAEITRLRELGRKIARPWIDGGVTAKEWCEAVDVFCPARSAENAE
jgi:hypothetical protein